MIFKKVFKAYKSYMVRPTIYLCVTKITTALALIMAWDRFLNSNGYYKLVRDGFFIVGLVFLLGVWYQYLAMDGLRFFSNAGKGKARKRPKVTMFWTKDIIDFVDEKVTSLDELEDDEQRAVRFTSNLICCLLYLVPALIALLIVH